MQEVSVQEVRVQEARVQEVRVTPGRTTGDALGLQGANCRAQHAGCIRAARQQIAAYQKLSHPNRA